MTFSVNVHQMQVILHRPNFPNTILFSNCKTIKYYPQSVYKELGQFFFVFLIAKVRKLLILFLLFLRNKFITHLLHPIVDQLQQGDKRWLLQVHFERKAIDSRSSTFQHFPDFILCYVILAPSCFNHFVSMKIS